MSYLPSPGGSHTALNVNTARQIKNGQGYAHRVFIIVDPSANGGIYDIATGGTPSTTNQIAVIEFQPGQQLGGTIVVLASFFNGLYVDPGTGGTVTVTFD